MFPTAALTPFCRARGVDLEFCTVTRLEGGEVNDNWTLASPGGLSWVLRQYTLTADPAELDCELAAADALAQQGFPTPAPLAGVEGRWQLIDDRPTALFGFVEGRHRRSGRLR